MGKGILRMFKIEELSGNLIKSGRFKEAIPKFRYELCRALDHGVIKNIELFDLIEDFNELLLVPDASKAADIGNRMLQLALRTPDIIELTKTEFGKNVKESREAR